MKNTMHMMTATTGLSPMPQPLIDRLLQWHDKNKTVLVNKGASALYSPWLCTRIRDIDITESSVYHIPNTLNGSKWNKSFVEELPELIEYFNCLPLKNVDKIILLETIKPCVPHIDLSSLYYKDITFEPANYRMSLRHNTGNGFYVQPIPKNEFGSGSRKERHSPYPKQYYNPEIGKWWVLNNWCCQHGSDWTDGDQKVLISVQGSPSEKHREVINSTVENVLYHPCTLEQT
jgi:hypothetical protein